MVADPAQAGLRRTLEQSQGTSTSKAPQEDRGQTDSQMGTVEGRDDHGWQQGSGLRLGFGCPTACDPGRHKQ